MEDKKFFSALKAGTGSFLNAAANVNETFYLVLLVLYELLFMILKTAWNPDYAQYEQMVRYGILSLVMWGSAIYLFYVIAGWLKLWDNTFALLLTAACILTITYFFTKNMSTNLCGAVMDIFFIVMACGKDYKKILKCILGVVSGMLVIAGLGTVAGFTLDLVKPGNINPGHSLGIEYPNSWGYLVFLVLLIVWYLYLQSKPVITCILFWAVSAFMMFYIYCRTIAFLGAAFPVFALILYLIERKTARSTVTEEEVHPEEETGSEEAAAAEGTAKVKKPKVTFLQGFLTAIPFLAFAFMLIVSMNYEWVHDHLYYTWFHNFAMRFVQSGLYFRTYGFPLVGNPYDSTVNTYVNVNGDFLEVGILDSSFAAYLIMRGLIWLIFILLWLSAAHYKALKKKDYGIILISTFILFFAMLERPGLEAGYNFVLFYTLAKVDEHIRQ